jgi:dTDP-L-rhamnose 4-epimerase
MLKIKNILITGGSGFIGSRLALKLLEKGYVVSVLDCLSPQIHGNCPSKTSPLFISIKDKVRYMYLM